MKEKFTKPFLVQVLTCSVCFATIAICSFVGSEIDTGIIYHFSLTTIFIYNAIAIVRKMIRMYEKKIGPDERK